MLSLKEIMSFFEGRFSLFGVHPLFCYFGGSLANNSYIAGSSDIDVIVVVENKPNIFFKGEVRGEKYSFIFDSLDEYLRQESMAKYSTSRLYGYLNFSFLSEKEIIFFNETIEAPGIVNNAHLNGEKAAVELFSRIKEPYVLQKELYHLGSAFNLLFGSVFSNNELKEVKNGNYSRFLEKIKELRKEKNI